MRRVRRRWSAASRPSKVSVSRLVEPPPPPLLFLGVSGKVGVEGGGVGAGVVPPGVLPGVTAEAQAAVPAEAGAEVLELFEPITTSAASV